MTTRSRRSWLLAQGRATLRKSVRSVLPVSAPTAVQRSRQLDWSFSPGIYIWYWLFLLATPGAAIALLNGNSLPVSTPQDTIIVVAVCIVFIAVFYFRFRAVYRRQGLGSRIHLSHPALRPERILIVLGFASMFIAYLGGESTLEDGLIGVAARWLGPLALTLPLFDAVFTSPHELLAVLRKWDEGKLPDEE